MKLHVATVENEISNTPDASKYLSRINLKTRRSLPHEGFMSSIV